ncbi:MAG: hypothetical protein CR981_02555 [Proteobacteria bacterium]|nr:MAG: hypothetical protein CR981_02555 [Pseudomonadota bacterium]
MDCGKRYSRFFKGKNTHQQNRVVYGEKTNGNSLLDRNVRSFEEPMGRQSEKQVLKIEDICYTFIIV